MAIIFLTTFDLGIYNIFWLANWLQFFSTFIIIDRNQRSVVICTRKPVFSCFGYTNFDIRFSSVYDTRPIPNTATAGYKFHRNNLFGPKNFLGTGRFEEYVKFFFYIGPR